VLTLAASGTSRGYIRWISAKERVPEDRRAVLVWGPCDPLFGVWKRKPVFLGISKYNAGADGGRGRFDCERLSSWSFTIQKVTHWAEIVGPGHGG
jgi:hypothetical protein